ncbi:MAG: hypothetical protein AB1705_08755 [Verrucomicrobiota bacterium]
MTKEEFAKVHPLACAWAREQQQLILAGGVLLTAAQLADAELAGVEHPRRVRLMSVSLIPMPTHAVLRDAILRTRFITPQTAGLALQYGIYIRTDWWQIRRMVVHELAHVAQFERLGGIEPFLEQYLWECFTFGYPNGPLEQEALQVEQRVCGPKSF